MSAYKSKNIMKKILLVATVVKKHIMVFHLPVLKMFKDMGWETAVAAGNDYDDPAQCVIPYCDAYYELPFERSPFKKENVKCIRKLKTIIESEKYNIIHCHTPVGGVVARMAARKARKNGVRVLYTAHGFHFYKGAPLKNWLIYYPVEWLCAHWTDTLITINQEDDTLAKRHMHAQKVVYVPGVGIDLSKFSGSAARREEKRKELGIPEEAKLLISVGELNENKNHETVIKAINGMDVYYIIAGVGDKRETLQALADAQGMTDRVKLLGYRADVETLCAAADVFVFPSFREGLSLSLMEAMASGLPCAVSQIRGNTDLIDENGGVYFDPHDIADVRRALEQLDREHKEYGAYNKEKIRGFGNEAVLARLKDIYMPGTDRDSKAEQELSSVVQNG